MLREIKINSLALRDIENGAKYYQLQQKGLGKRFENQVHSVLKKIQQSPNAASLIHENVRFRTVDKFPYIVLYEFDNANIYVHRIFNTHQSPAFKF